MPPTLQTKEGNPAKSVTSMEFEQWIAKLWKKLHSPKYQALLPAGVTYKLAFDNAGVHKGANLRQFGITSDDIVHVPALSSDMQKVVEHCHANLQHHMQAWLCEPQQQQRKKLPVEECMAEMGKGFQAQKEAIRKDVDSLPATYDEIIEKKGGHVSKKNR
jgi:hypothetical protein